MASITGTLTWTDGQPLGDAVACLLPLNAIPPASGIWEIADCAAGAPGDPYAGSPYAVSDATGAYVIHGLRAGTYQMHFFDFQWPARFFDQPHADTITLTTGNTRGGINAALRPAGYIAGTVHAPNDSMLENADVRLYRPGATGWWWFQSARSDEAGRYTFQTVISDTYAVGFFDPLGRFAPDYHEGSETLDDARDFQVPDGALAAHIDGRLVAGGALVGRVLAQGTPLSGVEVSLYLRGTEWLTQTITDDQGYYAFAGLGIESHVIYARDPAGKLAVASTAPFTISAGTVLPLPDLSLISALQLGETVLFTTTGTVFGPNHAPVRGAKVTLFRVQGLRARVAGWDAEPFTCPSRASTAQWGNLAPTTGAVFAHPTAEGLIPAVNPQITGQSGEFGWVLPPGCWFVRVEAAGYAPGVSALAGAPPRVFGLDVALTPLPIATPTQTPTPTRTPTPTSTPKSTPAASRTPTATPTLTQVPAPTQTSTGGATATSTAISTATSTASSTPTPIPSTSTPGGATPDAQTPTPDLRVLLPVVQK